MGITKIVFTYRISEEGPKRLAAAASMVEAEDIGLNLALMKSVEMGEKFLSNWMTARLRESLGMKPWVEDHLAIVRWDIAPGCTQGQRAQVLKDAATYAASWKPRIT